MNIFKINPWLLLFLFTLPCLFFSEQPAVPSALYFLFFLAYTSFLLKRDNEETGYVRLRNKIECVLLLILYAIGTIWIYIGKNVTLSAGFKSIFSIAYFVIFIDLAICLSNLFLKRSGQPIPTGKIIIIFFCLLVPPIGIYYLRILYSKLLS